MTGPPERSRQAFSFDGGPAGILMVHGLTGNPSSLRQIGQWLAARGHAISAPLLPGHGTVWRDLGSARWPDWEREAEGALLELSSRTAGVVAFGLSFGGAIALHLAARHPDRVRGVVVVNAYLRDRRIVLAPVMWPVLRSVKGIGNDIRKAGADELPYERIPVRSLSEMARFLRVVARELPSVRQPVLVFNAPQDHVVPRGTAEWLLGRIGSERTELVELPNSYHVATIDHDAELIFERTHEFAESVVASRATP
ncbi:MAG TPA: alpha/beta fold hydrolase [Actinomycetota bacterium]|nr:alpha/beta fold hydrolase [Actinomycetota bacterium]